MIFNNISIGVLIILTILINLFLYRKTSKELVQLKIKNALLEQEVGSLKKIILIASTTSKAVGDMQGREDLKKEQDEEVKAPTEVIVVQPAEVIVIDNEKNKK